MHIKRRFIVFVFFVASSIIAQAHEFWLQPQKFVFVKGENLTVNFRVGENFMGEHWNLKKHRLLKLELHNQGSIVDLKEKVVEGTKDNLQVQVADEGTH